MERPEAILFDVGVDREQFSFLRLGCQELRSVWAGHRNER
jgi:hypothetical protein